MKILFLISVFVAVAFAVPCEDSETWISETPKENRDCEWVAEKPNNQRCNRYKNDNGVKASDACAKSCGNCPQSQLVKFIEREMKKSKMPSLAAVVVKGNEVVWSSAFGEADSFAKPPVEASVTDTSYLSASISKTVMGVTLMKLYDEGEFDLDDDINDYLKNVQTKKFTIKNRRFPNEPITFRMLLTHTSSISDRVHQGIPLKEAYTRGEDPAISLRDFCWEYFHPQGKYYSSKNTYLKNKPGTKYSYSNIGSALAGYMVEVITGQDFGEYSAINLLKPIGMSDKTANWRLEPLDRNALAMPSIWKNKKLRAFCHYTFPDYPNGGLRVSAMDLALFMKAFMNKDKSLLDSSTINEMMKVQTLEGAVGKDQGLIWYYKKLKGRRLIGHNGGEMGASTDMFFNPETQVGVVMMSNGDGDFRKFGIAFDRIQDRLFDEFEKGSNSDSAERLNTMDEEDELTSADAAIAESSRSKRQSHRKHEAIADLCKF